MSDVSENEQIEEIKEEKEVPLTKKKPRTAKQIEAFERVKEKRRQNIEAKKREKALNSAKLLAENEGLIRSKTPRKIVEPEESESEEEIIVKTVKRGTYQSPTCPPDRKRNCPKPQPQPQPKKKRVRKVIIEESETSDSEDESESEDEPPRARVMRQSPPDRNQFRLGSEGGSKKRNYSTNENKYFFI